MKRLFNLLLTLFISVLFLTVLGGVTLIFLIDPNDYKHQINQYVEQQTGRTLTIDGDIRLTFFPQLGLNLGEVRLGNAKGFTEPTFASAQQVKIRIRLFPLFQKRLEFDRIFLDGATLTLARQPNGLGNWHDLKALLNSSEGNSMTIKNFNVAQLTTKNAAFIWDDQKLDLFYHVTDIQLHAKTINLEQPFPITADFHLISQKTPAFNGDFTAVARARINLTQQQYTLADLKTQGQIRSSEIPIAPQDVIITSQIALDLQEETLAFKPLTLQTLDNNIAVVGDMVIRDLFAEQVIIGKLHTSPLNLPKALSTLGLPTLPLNKSNKWLKTLVLTSRYEIRRKQVTFKKVHLKIADNVLDIPKLILEIAKNSLNVETFSAKIWGIHTEGHFFINTLFDQPVAKGEIYLRTDNLSETLRQFGQTISFPVQRASLNTRFQGSARTVILTDWHSQIDEHSFTVNRMQLDIKQKILTVNDFLLTAFEMKATGQFVLKDSFSQPQGQGYIQLATFNPRQLAQRFGQTFPELTDKTAFTTAKLTTYWEASATYFKARDFKLNIDKNSVQGNFEVNNFAKPKFLFNAAVDTIDLGHYLPLNSQKNSEPFTLPIAFLRRLNLEGTLKVAHIKMDTLSIGQSQFVTLANGGQLKLQSTLTLYEGMVTGDILLNVRGEKPFLQISQTLQHVKLAPLLKALAHVNTVTGWVDVTVQLTTTLDLDQEKQQLHIAPLRIVANLSENNLGVGQHAMRLATPSLWINLADTSLSADDLSLQILGLEGQARIQAQWTKKTFSGELKLLPFNLRNLLTRLGQTLPPLTDPDALTDVALTTEFRGQFTQIALEKLQVRADDTQIQGHVTAREPLAIDFNVTIDTIDLDRYLPADSEKKSNTSAILPTEILTFLHTLSLDGILTIAQLKIAQLTLLKTQFVVSSKAGEIKIVPLKPSTR